MDDGIVEEEENAKEDPDSDTDNERDSLLGDLESIPSRNNSKKKSSVRWELINR